MKRIILLSWLLMSFLIMRNEVLAGPGLCRSTANIPSWSESKDVPCSTDLNGYTRSRGPSDDVTNAISRYENQYEYETVNASQTDQILGLTGSVGDLIAKIHCVFTAATASPVQLKDGNLTAMNVIDAKAAATTLTVDLNMISVDGGWKLTTGTNVTCIGIGRFQ